MPHASFGGIIDPVNGGTARGAEISAGRLVRTFMARRTAYRRGAIFRAPSRITLDHICEGGIYDHLGGGFSRYSVDERWLVPHFEKMLYDNAQLLELLAIAIAATPNRSIASARWKQLPGSMREMTTPEGAFSASLDADSEGEEGNFYVWSYDEVLAARQRGRRILRAALRRDAGGNFERPQHPQSAQTGLPRSEADETRLAALREKLLACGRQVRPGLDDKVLADWNGLMIAALVNASLLFDEPSWLTFRGARIDSVSRDELRRPARSFLAGGTLMVPGLASDHAAMIRAALASMKRPATHELSRAGAGMAAHPRSRLRQCATGAYYLTAADAEGLVSVPRSTADEATPNHNAVAAQNLVRLAVLAGDDAWREKADRLIAAIAPLAAENLYMHMALLNAIGLRLRAAEIVVTGEGARRRRAYRDGPSDAALGPDRTSCRSRGRATGDTSGPR